MRDKSDKSDKSEKSEKRKCETCEHWKFSHKTKKHTYGECLAPIPYAVEEPYTFTTQDMEGEDCGCWKKKKGK